jgi:hypothetical protein
MSMNCSETVMRTSDIVTNNWSFQQGFATNAWKNRCKNPSEHKKTAVASQCSQFIEY